MGFSGRRQRVNDDIKNIRIIFCNHVLANGLLVLRILHASSNRVDLEMIEAFFVCLAAGIGILIGVELQCDFGFWE